jgi:tetratricopeptide (TPR) repeat protein
MAAQIFYLVFYRLIDDIVTSQVIWGYTFFHRPHHLPLEEQAPMNLLRIISLLLAVAFFTACAGGSAPPPERQPEDLHRSIRYLNKGAIFYNKGCYAKAAYQFQKAHEMFTAADNLQGAADSLHSMANAYYRLNEMPSAVLVYDEAVGYYQLLEDREGQVRALSNKSVALAASGMFEAAESALNQADAVAGNGAILSGQRLKARAILKIKTGHFGEAKQLIRSAMRSIPKNEAGQYASAQYTMGYLLLQSHQAEDAISYLEKALESDQMSESYFAIAQDLEALADCHAELGRHDQAVNFYKRSIKIFALLGRTERIEQISPRMMKSASAGAVGIEATLHWVKQWLEGQYEIGICR